MINDIYKQNLTNMIMITDVIFNGSEKSPGAKRWCEVYNYPKAFTIECGRFN